MHNLKQYIKQSFLSILKEENGRTLGKSLADQISTPYIVIYRAAPMTANEFFDRDFITLSKKFAIEHAENNHVYHDTPFHVIQALVSTKNVFDAFNPGEYFYYGKPKKGKEIYVSLGPDEYEGLDENRFDNRNKEKYKNCLISDLARMEIVENFLNNVEINPNFNIQIPNYKKLLDNWNGYDDQIYIQNNLKNNEIIFWEGWVDSCWEGAYAKPEYKNLSKQQVIEKIIKERFPRIAEEFGMTISSSEYFKRYGYIMKVVFKKNKKNIDEVIEVPIEIGDEVLGGRFKNKKTKVKEIGKNNKGDITVNKKPLLKVRLKDKDAQISENKENKIDPNFVYNYVNNLHKKGWEETSFDDDSWIINDHDYFELKNISLDDPNVKWNKKPSIYSKLTTEYPPIVISWDGYIIDGMHRSSSARERGDKTIQAYVGHKREKNNQISETLLKNNSNSQDIIYFHRDNKEISENTNDIKLQGGILLIKGEQLNNGSQKLFAAPVIKIIGLDRTKVDNTPGKSAKMAILSGEIYRLKIVDGALKAIKIDWRNDSSLTKMLKFKGQSYSIVLNKNKTPLWWETLKYSNVVQMTNSLSSTILSEPNINFN